MEKQKKVREVRPTNRHHLIGQAQKDLFNVFDERNVKVMDQRQHECLHGLFRALLTPKEQIEFMQKLFESVLSKKAYSILSVLCNMEDNDFYEEGLVKKYGKR